MCVCVGCVKAHAWQAQKAVGPTVRGSGGKLLGDSGFVIGGIGDPIDPNGPKEPQQAFL